MELYEAPQKQNNVALCNINRNNEKKTKTDREPNIKIFAYENHVLYMKDSPAREPLVYWG